MDERYLKRLNRATGDHEPIDVTRDPGSRLRRIPGTQVYFKWLDFELWRRWLVRLKRSNNG